MRMLTEQRAQQAEILAADLRNAGSPTQDPEKKEGKAAEVVGETLDLATEVVSLDMLSAAARGVGRVAAGALEVAADAASGAADLAVGAAEGVADVTGAVVGGALEALGSLLS